MCRLYTDLTTHEAIVELNRDFGQLGPYYDDTVPSRPFQLKTSNKGRVLRRDKDHNWRVDLMRWGLVPSWARDDKGGPKCVNARSETVASLPSFRNAFKARRCLVPATAWIDYQDVPVPGRKRADKLPYRFEQGNGAPMLFAGMWESWWRKNPDGSEGEPLLTYTIVTRDPTPYCAQIHDRMPILIDPDKIEQWIAGTPVEAQALLGPHQGQIVARPISRSIGTDGATLASLDPIGPPLEPPPVETDMSAAFGTSPAALDAAIGQPRRPE